MSYGNNVLDLVENVELPNKHGVGIYITGYMSQDMYMVSSSPSPPPTPSCSPSIPNIVFLSLYHLPPLFVGQFYILYQVKHIISINNMT